LLAHRVRATPDGIAQYRLDERDAWIPVTWREFAEHVAKIATALGRLGLRRGHRAAILAPTSVEWEFTQMACLTRAISVAGIDVNYSTEQRDQALRSLAVDILFVQDEAMAASIPPDIVAGVSRNLVTFADGPKDGPRRMVSLDVLMRDSGPGEGTAPFEGATPDDAALIVFSSGTTGRPKPISYTHRQVLEAVGAILESFPDIAEGSHLLCWLPLANLFQRMVDLCAIERGAISYVIGDPREVMRYVRSVTPHLLIGVPRFYEKLHAGIYERIAKSPRPIAALANRALAAGAGRARAARERRKVSILRRGAAKIADRLLVRRLRRAFGSNLRYLISGSAPMPLWLLDWFEGIGLPILEAYGVSENIIPVALNRPGARRPGTVGKPLLGQEVVLAEDSEILIRGPGVFGGYLVDPGQGAMGPNAAGFWATSDFGEFDTDGFLRLAGRKSEVFKLSTGRWIAPAGIEAILRRLPYVDHAMAVGAGHRFVVAILSVDPARLGVGTAQRSLAGLAKTRLQRDPMAIVRHDVLAVTAGLSTHQRPAAVLLTRGRLTVEAGELTSNLKLRRGVLEAKYAAEIEAIYAALEGGQGSLSTDSYDSPAAPLVRQA
jgi:long-chain acyl-CoA synthetase